MLNKIKTILALITGVTFILYIYRLVKGSDVPVLDYEAVAKKAAAKKEVDKLEEDLKELERKDYSDEEIEERFNK